jgi:hypothetical protein
MTITRLNPEWELNDWDGQWATQAVRGAPNCSTGTGSADCWVTVDKDGDLHVETVEETTSVFIPVTVVTALLSAHPKKEKS